MDEASRTSHRCSVLVMLGAGVELWCGGTCRRVRVQGVARYAAKGRMEELGRWRGNRWTSGWAAAPLAIRVSQATLRELKCNAAAWIHSLLGTRFTMRQRGHGGKPC